MCGIGMIEEPGTCDEDESNTDTETETETDPEIDNPIETDMPDVSSSDHPGFDGEAQQSSSGCNHTSKLSALSLQAWIGAWLLGFGWVRRRKSS